MAKFPRQKYKISGQVIYFTSAGFKFYTLLLHVWFTVALFNFVIWSLLWKKSLFFLLDNYLIMTIYSLSFLIQKSVGCFVEKPRSKEKSVARPQYLWHGSHICGTTAISVARQPYLWHDSYICGTAAISVARQPYLWHGKAAISV